MPELPEALAPEAAEEAAGKTFTRRVALMTAFYAVVLAITSLGGNNAMKETLLAQQQASDQWAFYQAKVAREHQYRIGALRLELDLLERGATMTSEVRARFEALRKRFTDEETRYGNEKKDVEKDAQKLEHERDLGRAKDPNFDLAEVLLQIAIVAASVAILSQSRPLFLVSILFAALGTVLCLNGYLLLFALPL